VTTETPARPGALGPLGRRLRWAFLAVAVGTIVLVAVAALVGTERGLDTASATERALLAERVAAAAADAYQDAGGWEGADLGPASTLAAAGGSDLVLFDTSGDPIPHRVADGTHTPAGPRGGNPNGGGPGNAGGSGGAGGTVTAPVLVDSTQVGTVRLAFGSPPSTAARTIAWWWIVAAGLAALALALLAARLVTRRVSRPLAAVADTARAFTAGDRAARTGMTGSGEIADVGRALDDMADEVVASEHSRRRAAADVAHELRTPLAVLQAGLEEARDGLVTPDPELLARLHDQSLRLGRIVADLAALSAAEGGAVQLRMQDVDLAALARTEVAAQEPRLSSSGLTVCTEADGAVMVRGDPDRLRQVLDNLLSNAGRYCRPRDQVTVSVRAHHRTAVLEVADSGPGIAPEDLPHVFDRLWRGNDAKRVGGSGIGLAVVHSLVTAHGGTVVAESDGRSGTTVRVELPLGEEISPPA
jgi:two-component system sensor histidine kinase BaeS